MHYVVYVMYVLKILMYVVFADEAACGAEVGGKVRRGEGMDHSVKAMSARGPLARLVARHRFESAELEELYARYACKLQRTSVGSALALWGVLAAALASVDATRGWRRAPQVRILHGDDFCWRLYVVPLLTLLFDAGGRPGGACLAV